MSSVLAAVDAFKMKLISLRAAMKRAKKTPEPPGNDQDTESGDVPLSIASTASTDLSQGDETDSQIEERVNDDQIEKENQSEISECTTTDNYEETRPGCYEKIS